MASFEAYDASSIALTSENAPVYRAIGVRAPATITTSVGNIFVLTLVCRTGHRSSLPLKSKTANRRVGTQSTTISALRFQFWILSKQEYQQNHRSAGSPLPSKPTCRETPRRN